MRRVPRIGGQDPVTAETNKRFFAANEAYARHVGSLDTYRRIREQVNREIAGVERLLDIGNGGVFDYDTTLVESIVAVDLFLDELPASAFPENVTPRKGNALALDEPDESYDGVLLAMVFHHLVGDRPEDLVTNVRQALSESHRVLRAGGKLVVVESCVPPWFYALERALFRPAGRVLPATRLSHPLTLQLTFGQVVALIAECHAVERAGRIPTGRWVLQFGKRWPTVLTPARPHLVVATKYD